jgi:alginate O-acetyltransferase complex protein AlgI
MLFNSYVFMFVFLPTVLAGYTLALRYNNRIAMAWLFASSLFFYGWWNPAYIWLIAVSLLFNYMAGKYLNRNGSSWALFGAVGANLFLLGYFKYAVFLTGIWVNLSGTELTIGAIILPLGISFYTFQQIAYLVDSYHRKIVHHDLLNYAVFVTFFPQLIAGPIVHQAEMLPQFAQANSRKLARNISIGATIFIIGLFKKVVIADNLAVYATPMFEAATMGVQISFLEAWGGATAYTLQLYFDFSGYADMAIGAGRMFGVKLPLNFNSPYKSTSIIEFWSRWHLTLTRFINAYLYTPITLHATRWRARRSLSISTKNLFDVGAFMFLLVWPTFITMTLIGLWHGAGWTFILFGFVHGIAIATNHLWRNIKSKFRSRRPSRWWAVFGSWLLTGVFLIITLVIFRAANWDTALNVLHGMTGLDDRLLVTVGYVPLLEPLSFLIGDLNVSETPLLYFQGRSQLAWISACILLILVAPNTNEWMRRYMPSSKIPRSSLYLPKFALWRPTPVWAAFSIVLMSLSLVSALQPSEFLYYQF